MREKFYGRHTTDIQMQDNHSSEKKTSAGGTEEALRDEQTQRLYQILDGNPIPTFVIDEECKITCWNRACELLTGIPASEIIGTDKHRKALYCHHRELMADLIVKQASADDLAQVYNSAIKDSPRIRTGYESEDFFPNLGENGKLLSFTAAPIKDLHGRIIGAVETLQDVTEQRIAEKEVHTNERRYRQLFESANDAILVFRDGVITDCNRKALGLFGRSRENISGLSPLDISPQKQIDGTSSEEEVHRKFALMQKGIPQFFEWRFLKTDGCLFDAEVSLTRFSIDDARFGLAIIRDISLHKNMVLALEEHRLALDEKSIYLEKVNQALKASLDHREVEKRAVEENILMHLRRFVFPYLSELEACRLGPDAKAYLNIIRTNLNDIVSRLSTTLLSRYIDLTPTEVRIADFIRAGKNSKEIAESMALSHTSIQWHRKNIRKKLGLTNKKINLYIYLNSLSKRSQPITKEHEE